METVTATRRDFFREDCCPIALCVIHGDAAGQHAGDLTDIRHTHDFSELVVITAGDGDHWIDGEIYPVSTGDIFLIQGNVEHYFVRRRGMDMYNIMFDDRYLGEHLRSLRALPGFNAFFLFEPNFRRQHRFGSRLHIAPDALTPLHTMLHRMVVESREARPGCDLVMLAEVLEIFVFISRAYADMKNPMADQLQRLGELIARLESEYGKPWTVAQLARMASMAPSTLLPIFKSITGHSPIDYLLRVRLNKAAGRLLKSGDSVSDIAAACGFSDSNYFSRQFRKCYHCSPREYRNARAVVA